MIVYLFRLSGEFLFRLELFRNENLLVGELFVSLLQVFMLLFEPVEVVDDRLEFLVFHGELLLVVSHLQERLHLRHMLPQTGVTNSDVTHSGVTHSGVTQGGATPDVKESGITQDVITRGIGLKEIWLRRV